VSIAVEHGNFVARLQPKHARQMLRFLVRQVECHITRHRGRVEPMHM
jgi:hypothetical protein